MSDNLDNEIDRFREEIADDLGHRRKGTPTRRPKLSLPFKPKRNVLILGGAGILLVLVIVLVALFSGNGNEPSANNLLAIQARLDQLEKRIKHLEGMEGKLVFLEKQVKQPLHRGAETERAGSSLTEQLEKLSKRLDRLEKRMVPVPAKAEAPLTPQEKPSPPKKGRYHEVRSGDTLYRIAGKYGITIDELCRLNNISPRHIIYPGQRLLVAPEGTR